MSPKRYQCGARGEKIRYAVVDSPLGRLLVAATDRGVCRVGLGRTITELTRDLRQEFSRADLRRDDDHLRPWVQALVDYLRGELETPTVPLDIRATAFQRQVWEVLRSIPAGSTCSYEEVASLIGKPKAARAVGSACARNPVPLVIPCHRVVRKDGGMGGYRFGTERKRKLLELERSPRSRS
jgi:AraC family transcriptional regulator of adaptative response/methylated-DNA-[protein]-cysteine methyltransferase